MSESFSGPAGDSAAESDVDGDDEQVEPGSESSYVGRVQGDDEGYAGEQGAEARARGHSDAAAVVAPSSRKEQDQDV